MESVRSEQFVGTIHRIHIDLMINVNAEGSLNVVITNLEENRPETVNHSAH